jgi:hypothetical protein
LEMRARSRMERGRKRKMEDKEKAGAKILMPEVFVSGYMKQQRNYVKYKREVSNLVLAESPYRRERSLTLRGSHHLSILFQIP